jgi:radical SAM superfamily enzyme YgiQ (UPF0313 family)
MLGHNKERTMKILLANAPWNKPGFYGVRAGSRWPHFELAGSRYMPFPFFLAYATALLKKNEFDVLLIDAIAEGLSEKQFLNRLADTGPDIVLYEVSTASIAVDLDIAAKTKQMLSARGIEIQIIFAGAHKEMYDSGFLETQSDVDYALVGEYEFTLLSLLESIKTGSDLRETPGLIYRSRDGSVIQNPPRPLETDLDKFPWPAREYLPMHRYVDTPGGIPTPSLQLWASRGCPFKCIFCAWPQIIYGGSHYRVRSPKDVVDELEWCINKYGFKSFYFDDDTFNIGKSRIMALSHEIRDRGINLPWAVMARADTMDREMLAAMKEAGLYALKYGVESGSQKLVTEACKGLNLEKVRETINFTRELDVKYHLTFMFGLPGETWETVRETIRFALDMDPDSLQFSIATPFPGSRFHEMMEEKDFLLSNDFNEYDGSSRAVIRTENMTADELEQALRLAQREYSRHCIYKDIKSLKLEYLKQGLKHPLNAVKRLKEVFFPPRQIAIDKAGSRT